MDLKLRQLTDADRAELDRGWAEIGRTIAEAIVEGGRNRDWAWKLIGPLGIYKRWMLNHWIARFLEEKSNVKKSENS